MGRIRRLALVTGLSGAGKSSALHYLEDLGFFWVDNLPGGIIPVFLDYFSHQPGDDWRVAIGLHLRGPEDWREFEAVRPLLPLKVDQTDMIFFEAAFKVLVTRYSETRRRHPAARDHQTVAEAIQEEASYLAPMRALAEMVIDTSSLTVPQLKERLHQIFHEDDSSDLLVFLRSFGFKYGANTDADMVLDARFLDNPHYDPALRPLTGMDQPIKDFLERTGEAVGFVDRMQGLFDYLIPRYRQEKKRYFTVDIGCTGGRHRSVYLVETLADRLRDLGYKVLVRHRDVGKMLSARGDGERD
ncbi:MAG: RNase adapter RapZ [Magnetococcales bacterium]|nr:RNase adapter RapZ [Magnetococcales bacterium]